MCRTVLSTIEQSLEDENSQKSKAKNKAHVHKSVLFPLQPLFHFEIEIVPF